MKILKTKKNYGFARLEELLEASDKRTEPKCPLARPCGGCQLQMMKYEEQLRWKEQKVRSDLQRLGGFQEIPMETYPGHGESFPLPEQSPVSPLDTTGRENWWPVFTPAEPTPSYRQMIAFWAARAIAGFWSGSWTGWSSTAIAAYREDTGKGPGAPRADPQRLSPPGRSWSVW